MALNENGTRMFMNVPSRRGPRTGLVTLCVTFSERELIPSYNRLREERYGKLLLRYLCCHGDHQSTGPVEVPRYYKGECVRACLLDKSVLFLCGKLINITLHTAGYVYFFIFLNMVKMINSILQTKGRSWPKCARCLYYSSNKSMTSVKLK